MSTQVPPTTEKLEHVAQVYEVDYFLQLDAKSPTKSGEVIQDWTRPLVVIIGADDQSNDFMQLARAIEAGSVIHVFLIGKAAPHISAALNTIGYIFYTLGFKSMVELVGNCIAITEPGDAVLFSLGAENLDKVGDWTHANELFRSAVRDHQRQLDQPTVIDTKEL